MRHIQRSILLLICLTILFASFVGAQEKQSSDLFVVLVNDKRGFIDRTGKIVIEPQWSGANDFSEGRAVVAVNDPHYKEGYINETGKFVIEPNFDSASDFHDGIALVGVGTFGLHGSGDHKFGFIDKNGKWLIEPKYKDAYGFFEGLAAVMNDKGKWGFIDTTGKIVISFQFETGSFFSEGLASVFVNDKYGYIDKTGKIVIKPQFTLGNNFSEDLAVVKIGGVLVKPYGMTMTKKGEYRGMYACINKTGKVLFKLNNTEDVQSFSNGLAKTEIKGDSGFINKNGRLVINTEINALSGFSEELALVILKSGGVGFIDKTGKIVLRTEYGKASDFKNGLAEVCESFDSNAKCGYINKTGKMIWQPTK